MASGAGFDSRFEIDNLHQMHDELFCAGRGGDLPICACWDYFESCIFLAYMDGWPRQCLCLRFRRCDISYDFLWSSFFIEEFLVFKRFAQLDGISTWLKHRRCRLQAKSQGFQSYYWSRNALSQHTLHVRCWHHQGSTPEAEAKVCSTSRDDPIQDITYPSVDLGPISLLDIAERQEVIAREEHPLPRRCKDDLKPSIASHHLLSSRPKPIPSSWLKIHHRSRRRATGARLDGSVTSDAPHHVYYSVRTMRPSWG